MRLMALIAVLILLIAVSLLQAQNTNHLDLLHILSGEHLGCDFGSAITTIDLNLDGYDDLIVASPSWNPDHVNYQPPAWGKIYIYYGGPSFDTVPDLVFEGQHLWDYAGSNAAMFVFNAGDVNGDGHDDLLISGGSETTKELRLYYGKTNPTSTPDEVIVRSPRDWQDFLYAFPLGDVNGDGRAEICVCDSKRPNDSMQHQTKIYIWQRGERLSLFRQYPYEAGGTTLMTLGDINGDGYDDCYYRGKAFASAPYNNVRQVLYFGGEDFGADSLVVTETTTTPTTMYANPLGDVNGDGYNDFSINGFKLYFGGETINLDNYLTFSNNLNQWYLEDNRYPPLIHADLNHDGFEDVIGSDNEYGFYDGLVTLWMGRATMNGVYDLNVHAPRIGRNFGWSKTTGDYNADGVIEIAISSPWWSSQSPPDSGFVHIYAANDQLHDTPATDEVLPIPTIDKWSFSVYPNPLNKSTASLNIKFLGSAYKNAKDVKVEIVNIKGEGVANKAIPSSSLHNGQWHSGRLTGSPLPSGVYLIRLSTAGQSCASRKIVVVE